MTVRNILDPGLYQAGDPDRNGLPLDDYAWLRENDPCHRQSIDDPALLPWSWVVTRYADVLEVDRNQTRFRSGEGSTLWANEPNLEKNGGKPSMLVMDGDDHRRNRRIVGRGFAPAVVSHFETRLRDITRKVLDDAVSMEKVDFVEQVSARIPSEAICDLMGVPAEERPQLLRWIETVSVPTDPDYAPSPEEAFAAVNNIWTYGVELVKRRRHEPSEDLMSKVASAVDIENMTEDEMMGMTLLLIGAGNETTRNAMSHGLHALLRHPDQMETLRGKTDAIDTAVEEILRWSSPVIYFRRTATEPTDLHGQHIAEGDPIAFIYAAANFDPEVFPDPENFDVTRSPNQHVAFGRGAHACLGAAVARMELKVMFEELLARTIDIRPIGEIEYNRDSFLRGVKSLPVHLVKR